MATVELLRKPLPQKAHATGDAAQRLRPRSATSEPTAAAGLAAAIAAMLLLRNANLALPMKALTVVAATAAPMAFVALRHIREDIAPSGAASPLSVNRLCRKIIGFWATVGALFGAYSVLPEYAGTFYAPVWTAAHTLAPWLVLASPIYIAYLDRRQTEPEDAYAQLGAILTAQGLPTEWNTLAQHLRGWIVKGFFLPLMFVYLVADLDIFWRADFAAVFSRFQRFYEFSYNASFVIDLLFAVVGYTLTLRLFDSQIRSAEPTVAGWVVCLVCYQPFWSIFGPNYMAYERDGLYWGEVFKDHAVLYGLWGSAILLCLAVYSLATVSFGLRFSNLTHRGIITTGPYRFTKHPAYIAKCVAFWLISVPFLSNQGFEAALAQSLMLVASNAIYVARAYTEERHLARDPLYREYQAYIRAHGIFSNLLPLRGLRRIVG